MNVREVPIDLIRPGSTQARRHFDEERLNELARSIREDGVVQPVVLRAAADGKGFELLAGERRWRAAQLAGLGQLPAVIRDDLDDSQAHVLGLIENLQRESLSPMETAAGLAHLAQSMDMTHEMIAERIGKSRAYVSNFIRLLNLQPAVRDWVDQGLLSLGHAKILVSLIPPVQVAMAREAVADGWSVRTLERRAGADIRSGKKPRRDADWQRLERDLADHLGYAATIAADGQGSGEVRLRFRSLDELDGLLQRIGFNHP